MGCDAQLAGTQIVRGMSGSTHTHTVSHRQTDSFSPAIAQPAELIIDTLLLAGYGYSTPKTAGGKIFCMLYALTGIPLNLVMFQSIGERLNIFVTFTLKHLKKCFRFKSTEVSYIV